jgi:GT2 family glycosyltransferase
MSASPLFGVVVIGRNEGERLVTCLTSLAHLRAPVLYVDSNSTDGSCERATSLGAQVLPLDMSRPFTAARARNTGFDSLMHSHPELEYVQFVDGDCELLSTWLPRALEFMQAHPEVAVACGRRRERYPKASVYNLLCDIEWNTPVGPAKTCGGDALVRVQAFQQVKGFREDFIAGEEPELCVRIRGAGWKVHRLDEEMTLHDAAMTRFSQWWKRTSRAGFAFAEGAHLHGTSPEHHWVRESRSALFWGAALPVVLAAGVIALGPAGVLPALAYPLQVASLFLREPGPVKARAVRAVFLVVGKFPEAMGVLRFALRQISGAPPTLIEYK